MAFIWTCSATVQLGAPIKVPGYPPSATKIPVDVKVRTKTKEEPTAKSIIENVKTKMDACYDVPVLEVTDPYTIFSKEDVED